MQQHTAEIVGGVDTHKHAHVAAAVDTAGRLLGTASFGTNAAGYSELLAWLQAQGTVRRVGVEGTGSYGAGLARHLAAEGVEAVEVNRPNRQIRRLRGKNDTIDAETAARAALNGQAAAVPKSADGCVEAIRSLSAVRRSSVKTRTQAANQINGLTVCAPEQLRQRLSSLSTKAAVKACAPLRPGSVPDVVTAETKRSLRILARRYQALTAEIAELDERLHNLCRQANPALLGALGVGVEVAASLLIAAGDNPTRMRSEASFAALCGVSPVEASSGRITRHRLNRGGNRRANNALWRIAFTRLHRDKRTQQYYDRRHNEGKTRREILRCIKRYIAREIYHLLTNPPPVHNGEHLRNCRTRAGLTLTDAAQTLNTHPTLTSQLERGLHHNRDLAERYHHYLTQNTKPTKTATPSCKTCVL